MSNLLYFHYERDYNDDIILISNNEVDLKQHLATLGYTNIKFLDLQSECGTCSFKTMYGLEIAKCFYVTKI